MKQTSSPAQKILAALTDQQLQDLLNVLLDTDAETLRPKLRQLDQETGRTVEQLLSSGHRDSEEVSPAELVSHERLREIWEDLWGRWRNTVAQLGDEEGKYAVQDAPWEPPYFDGGFFAEDLEDIAEQMLPYLDRAFEAFREQELFSGALLDIEESLGRYPEWMGVEYEEPIILGRCATRCALGWIWLESRSERDPGEAFLDSLSSLMGNVEMVKLDGLECERFISDLPPEQAEQIHHHFAEFRQLAEGDNYHSPWPFIRDALDRRFSPEDYLATCRNNLESNWLYGLDLIRDCLSRQEYAAAEGWLAQTCASCLTFPVEEGWYPEQSLFIEHKPFLDKEEKVAIGSLWQSWISVESHLQNRARMAAAELQQAICDDCTRIDDILALYRRYEKEGGAREAVAPLVQAWKDYFAFLSGLEPDSEQEDSEWSWMHWLISSRSMGDDDGVQYFRERVRGCLSRYIQDPENIRGDREALSAFTLDLAGITSLGGNYPELIEVLEMENPAAHIEEKLAQQRQSLLARHETETLASLTMQAWQSCLHLLIPDPAKARKSRYTHHAKWLKALWAVNPSEGRNILQKWKHTHKRRRNLWEALREVGLYE